MRARQDIWDIATVISMLVLILPRGTKQLKIGTDAINQVRICLEKMGKIVGKIGNGCHNPGSRIKTTVLLELFVIDPINPNV